MICVRGPQNTGHHTTFPEIPLHGGLVISQWEINRKKNLDSCTYSLGKSKTLCANPQIHVLHASDLVPLPSTSKLPLFHCWRSSWLLHPPTNRRGDHWWLQWESPPGGVRTLNGDPQNSPSCNLCNILNREPNSLGWFYQWFYHWFHMEFYLVFENDIPIIPWFLRSPNSRCPPPETRRHAGTQPWCPKQRQHRRQGQPSRSAGFLASPHCRSKDHQW